MTKPIIFFHLLYSLFRTDPGSLNNFIGRADLARILQFVKRKFHPFAGTKSSYKLPENNRAEYNKIILLSGVGFVDVSKLFCIGSVSVMSSGCCCCCCLVFISVTSSSCLFGVAYERSDVLLE